MPSPIPEKRVKELASEVHDISERVKCEVAEDRRARKHGFHGDSWYFKGFRDVIDLRHKDKYITVRYKPKFSEETIATIILQAPMNGLVSKNDHDERMAKLDWQKDRVQASGILGGIFTPYRNPGHFGYQYEFQVPINSESDLDSILDLCNSKL